jgi:hypothetical protein
LFVWRSFPARAVARAIAACSGVDAPAVDGYRSEASLSSRVSRLEASMNISKLCGALILGGLMAMVAPTTLALAQSNDKSVSSPNGAGTTATRATHNTNPTKHRYWRHRGGSHPHYGSRRVRT